MSLAETYIYELVSATGDAHDSALAARYCIDRDPAEAVANLEACKRRISVLETRCRQALDAARELVPRVTNDQI